MLRKTQLNFGSRTSQRFLAALTHTDYGRALLFQMQDYQPVGFYKLPSVPTSVCWRQDSASVMVTCLGGEVAQVDLSGGHLDAVDSSQVSVSDNRRRPHETRLEAAP